MGKNHEFTYHGRICWGPISSILRNNRLILTRCCPVICCAKIRWITADLRKPWASSQTGVFVCAVISKGRSAYWFSRILWLSWMFCRSSKPSPGMSSQELHLVAEGRFIFHLAHSITRWKFYWREVEGLDRWRSAFHSSKKCKVEVLGWMLLPLDRTLSFCLPILLYLW